MNKWTRLVLVVLALVAADQATKLWAASSLLAGPVVVSPSLLRFEYVENPGAAWNILSGAKDSLRYPFFLVVGLVMMTLIALAFRRANDDWNRWGLMLVLGGALGNYIDRVRIHHVIDFVTLHAGNAYYWPTFNVADVAISAGVVLLLVASFKHRPA
jgi:signal peptidase II